MKISSLRPYLFGVMVFGLGMLLGWSVHAPPQMSIENVREDSAGYKFINPLLFVKVPEDSAFPQYSPLKKLISEYVEGAVSQGKISDVSVYFRNMNSSQWILINPDEVFAPASMLKVVTLISVLRAAESDPRIKSAEIVISGNDEELVQKQTFYPVENRIRSGNAYTIEELIEHLIVESDNVANIALVEAIGEDKVLKTYDDLQLPRPITDQGYTARQYSHVFRALYNGTYLSRSLSEEVLKLLSRTKFDNGIVAGVPSDVVVSHKYGVHAGAVKSGKVPFGELHDCGIVYYPKSPYFICVMTKGGNLQTLEGVIKDISRITWESVDKLNS